jgi:hypothetical protein
MAELLLLNLDARSVAEKSAVQIFFQAFTGGFGMKLVPPFVEGLRYENRSKFLNIRCSA